MDVTGSSTLPDEKDPRTTGEYSTTPSGTIYEKEPAAEATTTVSHDHEMPYTNIPTAPQVAATGGEKTPAGATHETAGGSNANDAEKAVGQATLESGDDGGPVKPVIPGWRFALLGFGLCLGLFLAMLDTSIVATCLYAIALEFDSLDSINWVALAYTLTYLGCAVLFARVSDVIGRKAAFVSAFVIFIAFSLGCGFAQSMNQLIVFRALQGLGGSGLYSIAIIVFPELTPGDKMKFISAIIGLVIAVAGVLGPVVGGLLTHYRSWRYVFWINGPIGGVSVIIFWLSWPKQEYLPVFKHRSWKDLDYLGSLLLIAASVLTVFSFQNAGVDADQWGRAVFIAPLVLGVLSMFALFGWEVFIERMWKGKMAAAFPLGLVRNRAYLAGMLNTMFLGFPYFVSIYSFPIRFQIVNGKSALEAGLMLLPMLGGTAFGSWFGGVVNGKKNRIFETLVVSCSLMIIGCALETTVSDSLEVEHKTLGFLVFIGLGFGLSAAASTMLANIESPIRDHAPAQGIIAQVRILGGSLGIAASSAILGAKVRSELSSVLSPAQMQSLASAVAQLTPEQHAAVRHTYTDALKEDMIVCTAVLAVAFFLTFGAYRKNRLTIGERQRARFIEERGYQRAQAQAAAQAVQQTQAAREEREIPEARA